MARRENILLFAVLLALSLSIYTQFAAAAVGDTELLLVNARMLLDGKHLYSDLFTVLPPLIYWIYLLPVGLARLSGMPDAMMAVLCGLALSAASIAACNRLLMAHPAFAENPKARLWHALLLAGVFIVATDAPYFFDREHIFLLLVFPYLLRFMPGLQGAALPKGVRLVVGCMAGVGFCIKPHCAVVFAAVQLLSMLRTRKAAILLSMENLAVYALAALYALAVLTLTPEYVHIVMPMAFATYSAASQRINGLLYVVVALVLLAIPFADFRWRAQSPYRRDIYYLLGLCIAFLLYGLLNNGWGYAYNPLICMVLVVTGWALMDYRWLKLHAPGQDARKLMFGARACALSLAAVLAFDAVSGFASVRLNCTQHLNCSRWGRELIAATQGAHSFGAISGDFGVWARLSDMTGLAWDTRFNHLWMLPKFLTSDAEFTQRNRWILSYVASAFSDDMNRRKPDIMFVDDSDLFYLTPVHVDLVAYFSVFPDFKDAFAHYRHAGSIYSCSHPQKIHCSFEVYRRMDNGGR